MLVTDSKAQHYIGAFFSQWSLDHHCTCNKANLTVWIFISTSHHGPNSVIHHCYNVQVKLLKHKSRSVVKCQRKSEGALNTPKWAEKNSSHFFSWWPLSAYQQHLPPHSLLPWILSSIPQVFPETEEKESHKWRQRADRTLQASAFSCLPPQHFFFFFQITYFPGQVTVSD